MQLSDITPLVVAYNEEANIDETLRCVSWAERVVVVDSGSTDHTLAIAHSYPNVQVYHRDFDNHTNQWNYGLSLIGTQWVLTLDADYHCPPCLSEELLGLSDEPTVYFARFRYCVFGTPLNASLYPPRAVLFRHANHRFIADGHTQILDLSGSPSSYLISKISHDDRKPLSRWIDSQVKYAALEAEKILTTAPSALGWKDRLRTYVLPAPLLVLVYCLFCKRLILAGSPGVLYAVQRCFAELVLGLVVMDRKLRRVR